MFFPFFFGIHLGVIQEQSVCIFNALRELFERHFLCYSHISWLLRSRTRMFTKHTTADEMKGAHDQHTKRGTRRGMRGTILETTNLVTLHMLIRAYNSLGRGGAKKGVKENSTQGGGLYDRSLPGIATIMTTMATAMKKGGTTGDHEGVSTFNIIIKNSSPVIPFHFST